MCLYTFMFFKRETKVYHACKYNNKTNILISYVQELLENW